MPVSVVSYVLKSCFGNVCIACARWVFGVEHVAASISSGSSGRNHPNSEDSFIRSTTAEEHCRAWRRNVFWVASV